MEEFVAEVDELELAALKTEVQQLRDQLARNDRERIEYLQNVAHQLVAPLNAIKWHIENLTQARVGVDRAKKVLRSVYSQATLAVHLAKNFALMSNLEEDHELSALREPLQRVNLCQLMVNLADDFQPQGWDREVHVSVENKPLEYAPDVLIMKPLITQVFSNIIENAIKYSTEQSQVDIEGAFDGKNDEVTVSVHNRGIPLREEDTTRVFERGYRTQEAKNQYPAGTGFGLYIAKKIVELHRGKITARAASGGSVFSVTLPVNALEGKARFREPKNDFTR
jgi:signal transduction histidine kinase